MESVTLVLDASGVGKIDLRDDPNDVADYVAEVVGPLLGALGQIYAPATLALILDIAAKTQSYAAAEDAPCASASMQLAVIIKQQRALLRTAGEQTMTRPATAELLW